MRITWKKKRTFLSLLFEKDCCKEKEINLVIVTTVKRTSSVGLKFLYGRLKSENRKMDPLYVRLRRSCAIFNTGDILLQMAIPHLTEVMVKQVLDNCPLQRTPTSADRFSPHLKKVPRKTYTVVTTEVSMWPAMAMWWKKRRWKSRVPHFLLSKSSLVIRCQKANVFAVNAVKPNRQKRHKSH